MEHYLLRQLSKELAPWLAGDSPLVVAVSGGSDSLGLLHLMARCGRVTAERLVVAHFNHGLRPDATANAVFVERQAAALGLNCVTGNWELPPPGNLLATAREARYRFLVEVARNHGASAILTAHQRDDQAETVLEHLLRGSGVRGLAGIAPVMKLTPEIALVRPLLGVSRIELHLWLRAQGVEWWEDASNQNPKFRRNRIRLQLLRNLEQELGAPPAPRLAATAARLRQADQALEWTLDQLWPQLRPVTTPALITLECAPLAGWPMELQARVLQRCHDRLAPPATQLGQRAILEFSHHLAVGRKKWTLLVAGLFLERSGPTLAVRKQLATDRGRQ